MARKKSRQQDPNDSSDSGDGNTGGSVAAASCKHIARAVQLGTVKKKLKGGIRLSCDTCAKKTKIANIVPDATLSPEDEGIDSNWTYWLCLTCAHVGCGRGQYKHAMSHYSTPRSEPHDLVVDIETWNVWCYACEQEMALNSTKKLQECVEYIRRHMQTKSSVQPVEEGTMTSVIAKVAEDLIETNSTSGTKSASASKPSKVRGLMNLGNTCFYNSVLQCLSVTPYLIKVLNRLTSTGEDFILLGDPKIQDFEAPAVEGKLGDSGPLSSALLSLLSDMRSSDLHADTLRPQALLKQLQNTFPQFRGSEQHDAHELLRHLLEGVRSDDLKRFQRVILQQNGLLGRKNDNVADNLKKRMKLYGQQLNNLTLGVEGIFKGQLVSIIECQDCNHHSTRFESFLDLSLPVMEDKPLPPMRKKEQNEGSNLTGDPAPSKYQLKKQKIAAKRNNKLNKARMRLEKMESCGTILEESGKSLEDQESDHTDADVEDNVEQDSNNSNDGKDIVESGYNSEKQNTGESDGTSPSITTANEEGDEAVSVGFHPPSPPVSPSVTASVSLSPSAPASPALSTSPQLESPTAPVSACASASSANASPTGVPQAESNALSSEVWSSFHTHDLQCTEGTCSYNCKVADEMRCFTPIDEELRITITESGERSIHMSPVNPSDRPISRRGHFPGDTSGMVSDIEEKLLALYINKTSNGSDSNNGGTNHTENFQAEQTLNAIGDIGGNNPDKTYLDSNLKLFATGSSDKEGSKDLLSNGEGRQTHEESSVDSSKAGDVSNNEKIDVSEWCKTLAPRPQSEEGECSIVSCLNQFTSLELMTGNNKVGCDTCTLRQNKGSGGKTVYTTSTKQLLISSPPPVLILQLKRFMMDNMRFKKMQRYVSFPLDLDLAPFCSTKCKDYLSFKKSQTTVQYSLYGIVEHTGSLNAGHYVAYIKIRSELGENDPRWAFLPSTREFVYPKVPLVDPVCGMTLKSAEEKWYSISDSRVVEISEAKVLKVQAYLLFYERVE